jgi:hypothetical protein
MDDVTIEQAATSAGWKARAEREAAAILDEIGASYVQAFNRDTLVSLLGLAWIQGTIYGSHETLARAEQAFDKMRDSL